MANNAVFVDLGDIHGPAPAGDNLTDGDGRIVVVRGQTQGIVYHYATVAAAIADTANLTNGQYVFIAGGDGGSTGRPDADRGVWRVNTNSGAARGDYSQVVAVNDQATQIKIADTANFFASTDVEGALAEIGTKQVYYKLGNTSLMGISVTGATTTAFNAAIDALVIGISPAGNVTDTAGAGNATTNGIIKNTVLAYQIPLRDATTRNIIDDGNGNEVYARLTHDGTDYVVSFYSWVSGVETAFTFGSATTIDLGWVLASIDFAYLPPTAGVTDGAFFGDQAGVVGTLNDEQIITNAPAFTGLLTGLGTQQAVNNKVDALGLTTNGNGASLVKIEDAGNRITSTNVEGAITEIIEFLDDKIRYFANVAAAVTAASTNPFRVGEYVLVSGTNPNEAERGIYVVTTAPGDNAAHFTKVLDISHTAAEVLIADAGNKFTGTSVEVALNELIAAIGGADTTTRDYSSNIYVTDNDSLVTAIGKLDAAIGAMSSDKIVSKAFSADEAIGALASPRLVSATGTAFRVVKTVAGATGPKVEVVGLATGADYNTNDPINQGQGIVMSGLCGGFTGLTPGSTYYADPASAGAITATVPSTVGQWIIPVGVAVSATTLLVRIGEPNEIVPALPALQRAIHFKSTAGAAGGLGESGYAVAVGDIWIDNDASVQNPGKGGLSRHTMFVCKSAWTGAGAALTNGDIASNFIPIGVQG